MDSTWNTDAGRSRFLAAASHDLLQPLHVARLLTGALRERPHDDRTQALLGQLDQALGAVDGLLLALLDLTRLDAGGTRAHPQPVNLGELMTGLVGPFQVLAAQRGLRLRLRPTRAQVVSDPALLRRILQNLVCNALRYTASGTVLMGCRHRGDKVVVEIWDTGVGIAEDQREVIFEEFHRGTNRPSEGPPGLGLGLAIVRRMARMLDHPIETRSWPGRGSVFSLTLPIATSFRSKSARN
ncbi:MAG: HAMP domain-containing histidine kinase [Proteobacteria bacterium]|nr:MAG: HAMP domain-containing histidine kinase [Pseudomonadota bacterium]